MVRVLTFTSYDALEIVGVIIIIIKASLAVLRASYSVAYLDDNGLMPCFVTEEEVNERAVNNVRLMKPRH